MFRKAEYYLIYLMHLLLLATLQIKEESQHVHWQGLLTSSRSKMTIPIHNMEMSRFFSRLVKSINEKLRNSSSLDFDLLTELPQLGWCLGHGVGSL
jgi:hypothetical protein